MIGIVIAHHLDNLDFLYDWSPEFKRNDVRIYICEDKDERTTELPKCWPNNIFVYTHKDIEDDLGEKSWIIPYKTSAIKSYGFYQAWKDKCDVTITIDNDCYPDQKDFINKHVANLNTKIDNRWIKTVKDIYTRGFPYLSRKNMEVVVSHGLWSNVPDFDAPTAINNSHIRFTPFTENIVIPYGNYYPMCGMNLAFKTKITPLMYFGIQGPSWPYDRFDDIWAGVFSKKIIDHLGYGVISGSPSVDHRKQSNVFDNLNKEAPGIKLHEQLWQEIDNIKLTKNDMIGCYKEIMIQLPDINDYIKKLKEATLIWLSLFENGNL